MGTNQIHITLKAILFIYHLCPKAKGLLEYDANYVYILAWPVTIFFNIVEQNHFVPFHVSLPMSLRSRFIP